MKKVIVKRLKKRSKCSLQYGVTDIRVVDCSAWATEGTLNDLAGVEVYSSLPKGGNCS